MPTFMYDHYHHSSLGSKKKSNSVTEGAILALFALLLPCKTLVDPVNARS